MLSESWNIWTSCKLTLNKFTDDLQIYILSHIIINVIRVHVKNSDTLQSGQCSSQKFVTAWTHFCPLMVLERVVH